MQWTSDQTARLVELAAEDLSASQIAGELGETTRNAVIGKLHRMGLSTGHKINRHPPGEPPRRRRKVKQPVAEPVVEPVEQPFDLFANAVKFLHAKDHHCRWPLEEEPGAEMLICGKDKLEGISYCAYHARVAFTGWVDR